MSVLRIRVFRRLESVSVEWNDTSRTDVVGKQSFPARRRTGGSIGIEVSFSLCAWRDSAVLEVHLRNVAYKGEILWAGLHNHRTNVSLCVHLLSVCFGWQIRPSSGALFDFSTYWSFYWSIWICSTCFGRQIRPSSGALFDCTYTALVKRTDDAADRWEGHRSAAISVRCTKVFLKMGEFVARNM